MTAPATNKVASNPVPALAAAAMLVGASMAALIPALVPSADASEIAAVYPPWWTPAEVASAAARSGQIVRMGASPFVIIVRTASPGARAHLRAGGAVLFLNPLVGACGPGRTV